jgi:hypothetical protein
MVYIYDIILNFNDELLEFFEWEDNDNIKYIKRLPLIRVEDKLIKDVLENNILFNNILLDQIKEKTIYYDNKKENYPVIVISNQDIAIAILVNNNSYKYSRLLLDEEYEVLNIASKLDITKVEYSIIEKKNINNNLTREERKIKSILSNEIDYLYNSNKLDKLNYYYYEYFNKINNNKEEVYKRLKDSLNTINNNHLKLLEIVHLTNK